MTRRSSAGSISPNGEKIEVNAAFTSQPRSAFSSKSFRVGTTRRVFPAQPTVKLIGYRRFRRPCCRCEAGIENWGNGHRVHGPRVGRRQLAGE